VRWLGQRGLTQGSNLFGNRNSKLIFNPWKIPQSWKLGPKTDLEIFGQKRFCLKISNHNLFKPQMNDWLQVGIWCKYLLFWHSLTRYRTISMARSQYLMFIN